MDVFSKIINGEYDRAYSVTITLFNYLYDLTKLIDQVMWAFSIYLEAVAILPQLVLLQRTRNIDNLTGQYVVLLG